MTKIEPRRTSVPIWEGELNGDRVRISRSTYETDWPRPRTFESLGVEFWDEDAQDWAAYEDPDDHCDVIEQFALMLWERS